MCVCQRQLTEEDVHCIGAADYRLRGENVRDTHLFVVEQRAMQCDSIVCRTSKMNGFFGVRVLERIICFQSGGSRGSFFRGVEPRFYGEAMRFYLF